MRESDGEPERSQKRKQEMKRGREGLDPLSIGRLCLLVFGIILGVKNQDCRREGGDFTAFSKVLLEWEDKMLKIIWYKLRCIFLWVPFCKFSRHKLEIKSLLVTYFFLSYTIICLNHWDRGTWGPTCECYHWNQQCKNRAQIGIL